MRKYALAAVACVFTVSLALAGEVVFLGFDKDKSELKVKDGDETKTYKVTVKTTFKRTSKDGDKDVPHEKGIDALDKMNSNEKAKGKAKLDITTEGGKVTEIKMKAPGKKKN